MKTQRAVKMRWQLYGFPKVKGTTIGGFIFNLLKKPYNTDTP